MSVHELKSSLLGGSGGSSISWELWVDKGESLELVLVQVLNHFLIGRGQHRWVACEKTVKVLRIPSTLLRRVGRDESTGEGVDRVKGGVGMERNGWIRVGWEGQKKRKTKEGEWWVEPGCEMTLLEHGFKYQNKLPELGVRLVQLSCVIYYSCQNDTKIPLSGEVNQARLRYTLSFLKYLKHIPFLNRTRSLKSQTSCGGALHWTGVRAKAQSEV